MLDPRLALPPEYQAFDDIQQAYEPRSTTWTLVTVEKIESDCPETMWLWSDVPAGAKFGDPSVRLYVCEASDAGAARAFLASTAVEHAVVPYLDFFEPKGVDFLETPTAEEASQVCAWGNADDCRAWAFEGRYGRFAVRASWVVAGSGGRLSQAAFEELVRSIGPNFDSD